MTRKIKVVRKRFLKDKPGEDRMVITVISGPVEHMLLLQDDGKICHQDMGERSDVGFSPKFARRLAKELELLADEAEWVDS